MTSIEQIKAEIERQIKDPQEHCYGVSSINKLRELLDFIGTLEVEKPMVLEKMEREEELKKAVHQVSEEIVKEIFPDDLESEDFFTEIDLKNCITRVAYQFADWGAEHSPLPEDTVLFNKGVAEGRRLAEEEQADLFTIVALDAAQRAKEQMLKEAVEGEVVQDLKGVNRVKSFGKIPEGLHFGDKVRIIIVKE